MPKRAPTHPLSSMFSRIRRNHALEHATIHILSREFPKRNLIGRSDGSGFYIYGNISTSALHEAVDEALTRLRRGEHQLAFHPNCGTNLVTSAALAGSASFFALMGSKDEDWRDRLERLPMAVMATVIALIAAQPLGRLAQEKLTTIAEPGALEIIAIEPIRRGGVTLHRVLTNS